MYSSNVHKRFQIRNKSVDEGFMFLLKGDDFSLIVAFFSNLFQRITQHYPPE